MKSQVRAGFVIALLLSGFACREDEYELRTSVRASGDGQSYLTIEVFRGHEPFARYLDIEMVPGNANEGESQQDDGPRVRTYAEFDKDGRGALVTMHVKKDEKVLARTTQFVERPAPAGYVRAGMWNDILPPQAIDPVYPRFPELARRNRRQGAVFVEARINIHGTVDSVVVLNPMPNWDGLDHAAAEAVRQWRFRPATRDGRRIAVAAVQRIDFEFSRR